MTMQDNTGATAVLVHGAWANGSCWSKVTALLERSGLRVVPAEIPLTSFGDDVTELRRVLRNQAGPVVLAGHSYGAAVATAAGAGDANVKALVSIAGIVPDEGETVGEVFQRAAPHPMAPALQPDAHGLLWLTSDAFMNAMAPDASSEETERMAADQKPIALKCLGERMSKPVWREKPSWFLVAEKDRMVSPDTQRFTARRMGAKITFLPVDHTPLLTAPQAVADMILEAAAEK